MAWHKLKAMDDWGSITVHIGAPKLSSAGTWDSRKSTTPKLEAGEYKVRWPNGKEEILEVIMRHYNTTVGDMGHEYGVSGWKPYFAYYINGARIEVYAPHLGVEVWRD